MTRVTLFFIKALSRQSLKISVLLKVLIVLRGAVYHKRAIAPPVCLVSHCRAPFVLLDSARPFVITPGSGAHSRSPTRRATNWTG